jgi:hypothetical protein
MKSINKKKEIKEKRILNSFYIKENCFNLRTSFKKHMRSMQKCINGLRGINKNKYYF